MYCYITGLFMKRLILVCCLQYRYFLVCSICTCRCLCKLGVPVNIWNQNNVSYIKRLLVVKVIVCIWCRSHFIFLLFAVLTAYFTCCLVQRSRKWCERGLNWKKEHLSMWYTGMGLVCSRGKKCTIMVSLWHHCTEARVISMSMATFSLFERKMMPLSPWVGR